MRCLGIIKNTVEIRPIKAGIVINLLAYIVTLNISSDTYWVGMLLMKLLWQYINTKLRCGSILNNAAKK